MPYRSSDKEFMDYLKQSVLGVTHHQEKEQRKYSLDYLRTHVKLDDLHQLAIKEFPKKTIVFGEGSYNPLVAVVTLDPITDEQRTKLELAWAKLKVPADRIYYAHLRFVKTKKKQVKRQEILEKLIAILSPKAILTFDVGIEAESLHIGHSIKTLVDKDSVEEKKLITQRLKELRKIIV